MKPIKEQLLEIKKALTEIKKIAEGAMELVLTVQEGARGLQAEQDTFKTRLLSVETDIRQFNIKIRGLPEDVEQTADLQAFLARWLAEVLKLETGATPIIIKLYRLGAPRSQTHKTPRDVLLALADLRVKNKIMKEAKKKRLFYV